MKKIILQISIIVSFCIFVYACGKDDDTILEPAPTIIGFSPSTGIVGTQVTITGENFGSTPDKNIVKFGTITAIVSSASNTKLIATVPQGTITDRINVTTNNMTAISPIAFMIMKDPPEEEPLVIELDNTALTLYPYPTYASILKITTDIGNQTIIWESSDETLATVDAEGKVLPLAIGEVVITAHVGDVKTECIVTIKDGPVTKLELNNKAIELYPNDIANLSISTLEAEVAETGQVVWSSDDSNIAQVDNQGKVTALSVGVAIISATVDNFTTTCTVTVLEPIPGIPDVYLAGFISNDADIRAAVIWKNGVVEMLPSSNNVNDVEAYSIFVSGDNVYVAGHDGDLAILWKDGIVQQTLTDGSNAAQAYSVFVNGNDVYAAGNDGKTAILWKNGELYDPNSSGLTDGTNQAYARSVYVHNDNVYVAGYEKNGNGKYVAKLWMNGQILYENLTDGSQNGYARSVYVTDGHIYVAGYENNGQANVAKVWKDGTAMPDDLTDGTENGNGISIFVIDDETIYVAGYERDGNSNKDVAKLWKVGDPQAESFTNADHAYGYSVYVNEDDVYVSGYEKNGDGVYEPRLWKNGIQTYSLSDGTTRAYAYSVFVR